MMYLCIALVQPLYISEHQSRELWTGVTGNFTCTLTRVVCGAVHTRADVRCQHSAGARALEQANSTKEYTELVKASFKPSECRVEMPSVRVATLRIDLQPSVRWSTYRPYIRLESSRRNADEIEIRMATLVKSRYGGLYVSCKSQH